MFAVKGFIGKYELVAVIARCAIGLMYLAVDRETRRRVALKVMINPGGASATARVADEYAGARLQQLLATHTTAVPMVYSVTLDNRVLTVAMEYVEGENLDARIGDGHALRAPQAARLARDIAAVLAVAHAPMHVIEGVPCSILHGDVTPANLRLMSNGRVRVLDFGSARAVPAARNYTYSSYLTVPYASPERLATRRLDVRADLWGLGVILYEALTGRRPWEPRDERACAAQRAIACGTRPASLPSSCPDALARVVVKSLSPRPQDRYSSAETLRADLDAYLATTSEYNAGITHGSNELIHPRTDLKQSCNFVSVSAGKTAKG